MRLSWPQHLQASRSVEMASEDQRGMAMALMGISLLVLAQDLLDLGLRAQDQDIELSVLRAPRKIGPAESIGQGRRLLGQESQSVLPGQTGIFRGDLK